MGQVVFLDPIDHISGKIAKAFRTIFCFRKESKRKYTTIHSARTSAPTQEEILNRSRFGAVSQATQTRLHDLSKITADQAAFKAQKDTGYKTLYSYVWHLEADKYDNEQG